MAFLLQIGVSKQFRFARNCFLFEHAGHSFKYVQSSANRWADVVLCLVSNHGAEDEKAAYRAAASFLASVAWASGCRIAVHPIGGSSYPDGWSLQRAKPNIRAFAVIPAAGIGPRFDVVRLAQVTEDIQERALSMYREVGVSSSQLLSFLLMWQIIELRYKPEGWTTKQYNKVLKPSLEEHVGRLPLKGRQLGEYLLNDCRHAIAHLKRKPGEVTLGLDDLADRARLSASLYVLDAIVRHFIRNDLGVNKTGFARLISGNQPLVFQ